MSPSTASAFHLQLLLRRAAATAAATSTTTPVGCASLVSSARAYSSPARPSILAALPASPLRQYHSFGPSANGQREDERQQHRRRFSTAGGGADNANAQQPEQQQEEQTVVVYRGALGPSLRRLKLVSLANTAVALAASPTLSWLADAAPDGTTAAAYARAATVAATAAGFGVLTTLGLHWFTKPYVHEIVRVVSGGDSEGEEATYRLRALSPLGRAVWRPLDVSRAEPADVARPLATFVEGGKVYYVDAAGFAEGEEALREALTPMSAAEAAAVAAQQEQQAAAEAAEAAERQHQEEDGSGVGELQHQAHQQAEGDGRRG
jgi:hypothetical protein